MLNRAPGVVHFKGEVLEAPRGVAMPLALDLASRARSAALGRGYPGVVRDPHLALPGTSEGMGTCSEMQPTEPAMQATTRIVCGCTNLMKGGILSVATSGGSLTLRLDLRKTTGAGGFPRRP